MNNINLTVEFCAEDRARLDKSITLQEKIYALLLEQNTPTLATAEDDDLRKKLEAAVASAGASNPDPRQVTIDDLTPTAAEPAETPQDEAEAPTATDTPTEPEAPATEEPAPQEAATSWDPLEAFNQRSEMKPEPKPKYTLADIQAKVIALVQGGKKAEVRAICVSYAPQVTHIPEDKWGEVMAKLTELEG